MYDKQIISFKMSYGIVVRISLKIGNLQISKDDDVHCIPLTNVNAQGVLDMCLSQLALFHDRCDFAHITVIS